LERCPDKTGELARYRDGDLPWGFVRSRQFSKAPTQSLLRSVRDRNHAWRLSLPSASERASDAGSVLVVPGDLDEQAAHQGVARTGDAASSMFVAARALAWD